MEIIKQENGLFKVIVKGISQTFYTESREVAIEIAWKLRGVR